MGLTWNADPLRSNLVAREQRIGTAIAGILAVLAEDIEAQAKSGHPWANQTGAAEAGLEAGVLHDAASMIVTLYLRHGVSYGIFLELAHGGRFAVILPTLERNYGRIMDALRQVLA